MTLTRFQNSTEFGFYLEKFRILKVKIQDIQAEIPSEKIKSQYLNISIKAIDWEVIEISKIGGEK